MSDLEKDATVKLTDNKRCKARGVARRPLE
jgi:hypothetical protein